MLNRNVLIVEDESIIAESLKRRLSKFGYEVVGIAMTGEEAIEMAAEKHPDLILMDIQLRGKMDGVEAANHIYSTFKIPVIFITAHTDSTTIERAKVTEPFGYLPKPIKATELQTTIEVALFKSQQEQKRRNHTQLLEIALSSLRHAVIALDKHAKILFLNSFAEETLSITQSTFIDHHLSELFLINNLSCLEEPLENILEKFQPLTDKQYHLKLTTKNASSLSFSAQV
ncbi:MAG: response regulator, partial [Blastocatellia bacterium]|nr:response regulator [Blastocatellia bacterium]